MQGTAAAVKRVLTGRSRASREPQLLPRWSALPVASANPLSSVAYATQDMMVVLGVAGALWVLAPLSGAVVGLLLLVVVGHRQIIAAYPQGGGSYLVVRHELGDGPGLLVAAALLVDAVLTVAVSVAAGTAALVSAFPELTEARVPVALGLLVLLAAAAFRGVPDTRAAFAAPTYAFLASMVVLLAVGAVRCGFGVGGCPSAESAGLDAAPVEALTALVMLRAFASGAAALTGFEGSANAIAVFRYPQVREAAWTMAVTGALIAVLFVGVGALALATDVVAAPAAGRTAVAQIAAALFGETLLFYLLQLSTAAVLGLAAISAFVDFPRLTSVLARDGLLPRQLTAGGDRLVFSNGMLLLTGAAAVLLVAVQARVSGLLGLYVLSVFVAFACAHAGMAAHWWRTRTRGWARGVGVNAAAAGITAVVVAVVVVVEFTAGAWMVLLAMAALMAGMWGVRRNYRDVGARLRAGLADTREPRTHDAVIVVDRIDEPAARALSWVLGTHPRSVTAVGVPIAGADLEARWASLSGGLPLTVVADARDRNAPDRLVATIAAGRRPDTPTTVVLAEELARGWGDQLLSHRLDLRVKAELRQLEGVAVADVTSPSGGPGPYTVEEPAEHHVLVLVSSVHTGVRRALGYAKLLQPTSMRALSINVDGVASHRLLADWRDWGLTTPLEVVDSPFRSLAEGVRQTVRRFAPDGRQTVVSCVLPELIGLPPWARPLHSQSAETIRSALLFERGVITITVPYRLPPRGVEPSA